MDSFFSKLRQQVSFHQIDSDSEEDDTAGLQGVPLAASCPQNRDIEVDDFLIVEADSQNTVNGTSFSSHRYPDSPPTYKQVSESDELPSYETVLSGSYTIVSKPAEFPEVFSPMNSNENYPHHNQKSAVNDVPFRLHPTLEMQHNIHDMLNSLDLKPASFDWFKHSHDFKRERLWLRDFISDEMTNIDDFIIPTSNAQKYDKEPSKEGEQPSKIPLTSSQFASENISFPSSDEK